MNSQLLWGIGDVFSGIGDSFGKIANWITDKIGQYIDYAINVILQFVYEILKVFFLLIDFIQLLFRKMAGLDTVSYNGKSVSGDLAWWLMQQDAVKDALISLTVVAVVMVFIATFVAIVKNNYSAQDSKGAAVGPVIGKAFKALISFVFVPIVCYFGVFVSNGLLKTVDQATRLSSSVSISGEIFSASALSSNRVRISSEFAQTFEKSASLNYNGILTGDSQGSPLAKSSAEKIDRAFASKMSITDSSTTEGGEGTASAGHKIEIKDSMPGCEFMFNMSGPGTITSFDYMNTSLVFVYYDFTKFNWLFAFVSCFFITATLLYAALGVIQRLFELTILFAISPPFIALMPLDNGSAFKAWSKKFIQSTVVMYGTVVGLNFFFIIAPLLQNINLFHTEAEIAAMGKVTCDLFNGFAHILFIMCGAMMIKDMTKLVTELVADKAEGLGDRGQKVWGDVKGSAGGAAKVASGVHNTAKKPVSYASNRVKDHYSAENVAKRKDAKQQKLATKATIQGAKDAGEIGYLGGRRLKKELNAEAQGKQTLRTRVMGRSGKLDDLVSKSQANVKQQTDKKNKANPFAVEEANAKKRNIASRVASSPNKRATKAVREQYGKQNETQQMKDYRTARKEYANASVEDTKRVKEDEKAMRKQFRAEGSSRKDAKQKASGIYYDTSKGLQKGSYKGNIKKAEKDLKKSMKLKDKK